MSYARTAERDTICPICGEMIIHEQDQIRLHGLPAGRIVHKGTTTIIGTCPHADCAPEEPTKAPHLTWWQIENLLNLLRGQDVSIRDDDNTVDRTALRRFISACRLAKDNKHNYPMRADADPVFALPDGFYTAYVWLLKRAQQKNPVWRPVDIRTRQPWYPKAPAPAPEEQPRETSWADEQARRQRTKAFMEKFKRRA